MREKREGVMRNAGNYGKSGFTISDIKLPQSVDANNATPFELSFTVTSINNNAEDVVINVNLPSGIVNRTISRFFVGNLKKGESSVHTVTLYPTDSVAEGFANIEISVSAKDTEETGLFTGLYVKNEAEAEFTVNRTFIGIAIAAVAVFSVLVFLALSRKRTEE